MRLDDPAPWLRPVARPSLRPPPAPSPGGRREPAAAALLRLALATLLALLPLGGTAAQEVRLSASGICHCPDGAYHSRIRAFAPFATLAACLDAGGREPLRGQGSRPAAAPAQTRAGPPRPPTTARCSAAGGTRTATASTRAPRS